ncbi:hypothetical protein V8E54_014014 [Elaphomyces granulatus]
MLADDKAGEDGRDRFSIIQMEPLDSRLQTTHGLIRQPSEPLRQPDPSLTLYHPAAAILSTASDMHNGELVEGLEGMGDQPAMEKGSSEVVLHPQATQYETCEDLSYALQKASNDKVEYDTAEVKQALKNLRKAYDEAAKSNTVKLR